MAGGGIRGGQVIGSSDPHAAEPVERPVDPAEVVATMYHTLGIDARRPIMTPEGHSLALLDEAGPLVEALV